MVFSYSTIVYKHQIYIVTSGVSLIGGSYDHTFYTDFLSSEVETPIRLSTPDMFESRSAVSHAISKFGHSAVLYANALSFQRPVLHKKRILSSLEYPNRC